MDRTRFPSVVMEKVIVVFNPLYSRQKDTMVPCYFSLPHFKGAIASRVSQTPISHTAHHRNSPKF